MNLPSFQSSAELQAAITRANEAFIEFILVASRLNVPATHLLLGIDETLLQEFSKLSKSDLLPAGRLGAPLFVPRITEASALRQMFMSGCSRDVVLRELTRKMPLELINKK